MGPEGSCQPGQSTQLTGPGWPLKVKVIKVDRTSHDGLQVISVDLETGTLGRSKQIDQQALKVEYFQAGAADKAATAC